jgi:phosphatidylglycerol:prolipoprotein diacylglycerol transferase
MNPTLLQFGGLEIRAFTFWLALGGLLSAALVLWRGRAQPLAHLDVITAAAVCGVIGARAEHVALNWAYFSANTAEIFAVSSGGVNWHGGLLGILFGVVAMARWRRLHLPHLLDSLALCLPIGALVAWQACAAAACGYGIEVRTLADYPLWLATEAPDIYGVSAPRLNLPLIGMLFAVLLGVLAVLLIGYGKLQGGRFWLLLALYGLAMAFLSGFRAEYVPIWFGVRADQALDLWIGLWAAALFVRYRFHRRRTGRGTPP